MLFDYQGAGRQIDIIPAHPSDIVLQNSILGKSLTSVSAGDLTEKFVVPQWALGNIGSWINLDIDLGVKNASGSAKVIIFYVRIEQVDFLVAGSSGMISNAATRSAFLSLHLVRSGSSTGALTAEFLISGTGGGATGSGSPVGGFLTASSALCNNNNVALPSTQSPVTISVLAYFTVANTELTLAVNQRRLYMAG